ncbi:MAG: LamG-like jellyroll fold domain-containing protein, partial [Caldilineaceae bacterium]
MLWSALKQAAVQIRYRAPIVAAIVLLVSTTLLVTHFTATAGRVDHSTAQSSTPQQMVNAAWNLVQAAGRYHFTSQIEQITTPAASLNNVGRSPQHEYFALEGDNDLRNEQLLIRFLQENVDNHEPSASLELKIDQGRAFTRQSSGDWQASDDLTTFFVPNRDPLVFLQTIKNVNNVDTPSDTANSDLSHLRFDLDAMRFAELMRQASEQQLQRKGDLPTGMELEVSPLYSQITGSGEMWLQRTERGQLLPLRLRIQLSLPADAAQDQVSATIDSSFDHFDAAHLLAQKGWFTQASAALHLPQNVAGWQQLTIGTLCITLMTCFAVGLILFPRSRRLYAGVIGAVLLGMLLVPLLEAQRLYAFSEKYENVENTPLHAEPQANLAAAFESAPQSGNLASLNAAPAAPLAQTLNNDGVDSDGDGASDSLELAVGSMITDTDSDDDGLADGIEITKLGTDPTLTDSDGDGLSDPSEVAGFVVGGKRWFTSPLTPDSNNDGLTDGADCPEQSVLISDTVRPPCGDGDLDGTPDIFDADNDGDGVPDGSDLSPSLQVGNAASPLNDSNPFKLAVNGLTVNKPVYVDLQLRPLDPKHLTYALHVLDWPSDDTRGYIQRRLSTTYKTTTNPELRSDDPMADNGDLRLVPMISVRIPKQVGSYGNLPTKPNAAPITASSTISEWVSALDVDKLTAYSMSVRKYDENTLEVLSPLFLHTDQTGGERVAFGAHLLYWPSTNTWGTDHSIRLVWAVQMITDLCVDGSKEGEAFCNNPGNRRDVPTIIQVYDDSWILSGMTVSEQRGLDVAVVRGATPTSVDTNLWRLGYGLANSFSAGRDSNNDGNADLSIPEIQRRWGAGSLVTESERWAIPVNSLNVTVFNYEHGDEFAKTAISETLKLLSNYPTSVAPTFLYAQTRKQRSLSLSEATVVNGRAVLEFDSNTPIITLNNLSWSPYRYNSSTRKWTNYDIRDYLNQVLKPALDSDPNFKALSGAVTDIAEAQQNAATAKAIYLTLYTGFSNLNNYNGKALTPYKEEVTTDTAVMVIRTLVDMVRHYHLEYHYFHKLHDLDGLIQEKAYARKGALFGAAVILFTAAIVQATGADQRISNGIAAGINVAMTTSLALRMSLLYQRAHYLENGVWNLPKMRAAVSELKELTHGFAKSTNGFLLGLASAWGLYLARALASGDFGNPEFISEAAASTVIALALFALTLALGPVVGAAVGMALFMFDALAGLICAGTGSHGELCHGITLAFAHFIYDTDSYVDMEDQDRLHIESFSSTLVDPNRGFVSGSLLRLQVELLNALRADGNPYSLASKVRKSTFAYSVDGEERNLSRNVSLRQMVDQWSFNSQTLRFEQRVQPTRQFQLGVAGINVPYTAYLNEGFVVPVEECYAGGLYCDDDDVSGNNHINLSDVTVYDVLPNSLDGFVHVTPRGSYSYGMNWSDKGQLSFPTLADADGDGLRSKDFGGSDPNDLLWDTDGDGLNDLFESEHGTNATLKDSDSDGLDDAYELQLGTDPNRSDSDYDGLTDKAELDGWEFVYGFNGATPLKTWVHSDPLVADLDGDDLLDSQERRYGYNPNVASDLAVMSYSASLRNPALPSNVPTSKMYARPGQTVYYNAEIGNELANRNLYGQLLTQGDNVLVTDSNPQSFYLQANSTLTRSQPISVGQVLTSSVYRVSQIARGYVDAPLTVSNGAPIGGSPTLYYNEIAYFSFDGSNALADSSGTLPVSNAICTNCPNLVNDGKSGKAMSFSNNQQMSTDLSAKVGNKGYTISAWVYPTRTVNPSQPHFSQGFLQFGDLNIGYFGTIWSYDNKPYYLFMVNGDPVYITNSFYESEPPNQWYHIVVTLDGEGNSQVYLNGQRSRYGHISFWRSEDRTLQIGQSIESYCCSDSAPFTGKIDSVKVFNHPLDGGEALREFNGSAAVSSYQPIDLSLDRYTLNGATKQFLDRSTSRVVATCSPCILTQTPWQSGLDQGDVTVTLPDIRAMRYSMAIWLKPFDLTYAVGNYVWSDHSNQVAGYNNLPNLSYDAAGKVTLRVANNPLVYTPPGQPLAQRNRWHQLALTYDGTTFTIYADGALLGSTTSFPNLRPNIAAPDLQLVGRDGGYNQQIDEFQLFPDTLTAGQVRQLYNNNANRNLDLRFEDPPGSTRYVDSARPNSYAICTGSNCPISNVEGRAGRALSFASGQAIELAGSKAQNALNQFSVAAWVKGNGEIMQRTNSAQGGGLFRLTTTGVTVSFTTTQGIVVTRTLSFNSGQIPANQWTHIAATFSALPGSGYTGVNSLTPASFQQIHLYVNGVKVASDLSVPVGQLISTSQPLRIGSGFSGTLDEVQFYPAELTPDDVGRLYRASAPEFWWTFDEDEGLSNFADRVGGATTVCSSCPTAGRRGQLGQSVYFSGTTTLQANLTNQPSDSTASPQSYLFWFKSQVAKGTTGVIFDKQQSITGYQRRLTLQVIGGNDNDSPDRLNLHVEENGSSSDWFAPIRPEVWYQAVVTSDGGVMRLYLNGQLAQEGVHNGFPNAGSLRIGTNLAQDNSSYFRGFLDELRIYRAALTAEEILPMYEIESAWVEERSRFEVTVDVDAPRTAIRSDALYRPNRSAILDIFADDPTSPLQKVELLVNGAASNAVRCQDDQSGTAYCPTFTPAAGEGSYTLASRATDLVGYQTTSISVEVRIDGQAPVATLNFADNSLIAATQSISTPQQWIVPLGGTISDPTLVSGQPGSGVRGLQVTLYDVNNQSLGLGATAAELDNQGNWQSNYIINGRPNGRYTVELVATDVVGNSRTLRRSLRIDNAGPDLLSNDLQAASLGASSTQSASFNGVVSDTFPLAAVITPVAAAGVGRVEIAFVPDERGSTWYNEPPASLLGSGPVLWLDFDEAWASEGLTLTDRSIWQQSAILHTAEATNNASNGIVGDSALRFDGVDDRIDVAANSQLNLASGNFTQLFWLYPISDTVTHVVVGGGSGAARYPTVEQIDGNRLRYSFGDGTQLLSGSTGALLTPNTWNFVAVTFDKTNYRIYLNGDLVHSDPTFAGHSPTAQTQLTISDAANPLAGQLDDLRIYQRTLSSGEIRSLYQAGWRTLLSGSAQSSLPWSASRPEGVEGYFNVQLRAIDVLGNVGVRTNIWHGMIDTLAPRVVVSTTDATSYTVTVEDFNLSEEKFVSACGYEVTNDRNYYAAPWFTALTGGLAPLYQLSAHCTLPTPPRPLNACDSFGHCLDTSIVDRCYATRDGVTVYHSVGGKALRDAIAAAAPGETVKVAGTCSEPISTGGLSQLAVISKPLTLAGGYTVTNWLTSYPISQPTTLDALGLGRVISASAPITLSDLALRNGAANGDGAAIWSGADLVLTRTTLNNHVAGGDGGAIYTTGTLRMTSSIAENNRASRGGAIYAGDQLFLSNSSLSNNQAITATGGAIYATSTLSISQSTLATNTANLDGGAIFAAGNLNLQSSEVRNNQAIHGAGGAIYANAATTLNGAFLFDNRSQQGGAIATNGGLTVSSSRFLSNQADSGGAALWLNGGDSTLVNTLLVRNSTTSGATVAISTTGTVQIVHTTIASPTLASGAAIEVLTGTLAITNTIISNHAFAILTGQASTLHSPVSEDYNLFFGNTLTLSGTVAAGNHSRNFTPAFANAASDDYHLTAASGALSAGQAVGVLGDLDGATRPQGNGIDIGAYESALPAWSDLAIGVTASPNVVLASEPVTYSVWMTNVGTLPATDLTISGTIPLSLTLGAMSQNRGALLTTGNDFTITQPLLYPGEVISISWPVTTPFATADLWTSVAVTVSNEMNLANNSAAQMLRVVRLMTATLEQPAAHTPWISPTASFVLSFPYALDPSTINSTTVAIYGNQGGQVRGDVSYQAPRLFFTPTQPMLWGDVIHVGVGSALLSTDRDPATAQQWQFMVGGTTGSCPVSFAQVSSGLPTWTFSAADWGDYDGDGDLDLAMNGTANGQAQSRIYRNDGSNKGFPSFIDIQASLLGLYDGSVTWADIDKDGDLDLLLTGKTSAGAPSTRLYRNDAGTFNDSGIALPGAYQNAAAWGDVDNDGDLDLALSGQTTVATISQIYLNQGATFTALNAGLPGVNNGSLAWGDYDNDGDLDLALSGTSSNGKITRIYRNNQSLLAAPTFEEIGAGLPGLFESSLAWGDVDQDGDLDLAVSGRYDNNSGLLARLYRNDGGLFGESNSFTGIRVGNLAWGDYDNDSDLDLLSSGNEGASARTRLYQNGLTESGIVSFTEIDAHLPAINFGTVQWGDLDGDGSLDLLFNEVATSSEVVSVYRNSGCADLAVESPVVASNALAGNELTYRYALSNQGVQAANVVTFSVSLPWAVDPLVCQASLGNCTVSNGEATLALDWLPVGATSQVTITANAPTMDGQITTTATLSTPNDTQWSNNQITQTSWIANPMYVVASVPAPGAENVPLTSTLVVTFTDGLDLTSLISTSFVVQGSQHGQYSGQLDYDADSNVLSFTPDQPFHLGETVHLAVSKQLRSQFQGATRPYQAQFRTGLNANSCPTGFQTLDVGLAGEAAGSSVWGDADGDGDLDLLLAGAGGSYLYRNDTIPGGAPIFYNLNLTLASANGGEAAWGDYDNDGDLDILLSGSGVTKVYRNNGGLQFSDLNAGLVGLTQSIASWVDYDNDGDLDLFVTGSDASSKLVTNLYRNQNGLFTPVQSGLPALDLAAAAWGDIDNDGDLDLVLSGNRVANGSGNPQAVADLYRNDGLGHNGAPILTPLNAGIVPVLNGSFEWGDADYDGDLDLLASGDVSDYNLSLRIYINNGVGNFTTGISLTGIEGDARWSDYDNDGDLDIVAVGNEMVSQFFAQPRAHLYRNDGNLSFVDVNPGLLATYATSLDWGDFDQDGRIDLIVSGTGLINNSWQNVTRLYRNNGCADVSVSVVDTPDPISAGGTLTQKLTVRNLGDQSAVNTQVSDKLAVGMSDVICQASGSAACSVTNGVASVTYSYLATGASERITLTMTTPPVSALISSTVTVSAVNDFNTANNQVVNSTNVLNLMRVEAVSPVAQAQAVALDHSLQITFAKPLDLSTVTSQSFVVRGDQSGQFTGTLNYDVLTQRLTFTPSRSYLWGERINANLSNAVQGNSDGSLSPYQWQFSAGGVTGGCSTSYTQVTTGLSTLPGLLNGTTDWADYDSDGDLDLLMTGQSGSTPVTKLYRNDAGTWTSITTTLPGVKDSAVAWGDYDNDGDPDLLLTGNAAASGFNVISRIYRNDGNGTFTDIIAGFDGVYRSAVAWVDYDSDGDLDVILTGANRISSSLFVRLYQNEGGNFSSRATGLPGVDAGALDWGDYDNDGDPDLLLSGNIDAGGMNRIAHIYRNDTIASSTPNFVQIDAALTGITEGDVRWVDVDNDLDLDIVIGGRNSPATGGLYLYRNLGEDATGNTSFAN